MARIEFAIRKDAERAELEAQRDWRARDAAENVRIAEHLTDRLAPAIARAVNDECRQLRKEIEHDRKLIQRHGKRIAREKFARFKARRR